MDTSNSYLFEMKADLLYYDPEKSILLCKQFINKKTRWAKKINDINVITDITEDSTNYYIVCESTETSGQFLALNKNDGSTIWYIPGKSYFQQLFDDHLYIIFIDNSDRYYLIKVDKNNGNKIWFHEVDIDLNEYSFRKDRIIFKYNSGKVEKISPITGIKIS